MNKKLSRIAAIALSAAMVTSAFAMSTSASFAATSTLTQTSATTYAAVYDAAASKTTDGTIPLSKLFTVPNNAATVKEGNATGAIDVGDIDFTSATVTSSNAAVAQLIGDNTTNAGAALDTKAVSTINLAEKTLADEKNAKSAVVLKGTGTAGVAGDTTITINAKYKSDDGVTLEVGKHNQTDTVKSGDITLQAKLKVYPNGCALVLPNTDAAPAVAGTYVPQSLTVGINEQPTFKAYKVTPDGVGKTGLAAYTAASYTPANTVVKTSSTSVVGDSTAVDTFTAYAQDPSKLASSAINTKVGVYDVNKDGSYTEKLNTIGTDLTVDTYYAVNTKATDDDTMKVRSDYGTPTRTYLNTTNTIDGAAPASRLYDVTNRNIKVATGKTLAVTGEGAIIGNVTGAGKVTVDSGTVASINVSDTVAVSSTPDKGNVKIGNITSAAAAASITITGAANRNSDTTYSAIVTGDLAAPVVSLISTEDANKAAQGQVTVGKTTVTKSVDVTTSKNAKTLTAGAFAGTQGTYADCPYVATFELKKGTLTTSDLQYFGKVTVGTTEAASLTSGAINTGTYGNAAETDANAYGFINAKCSTKAVGNNRTPKLASASTISLLNNSKLDATAVTVGKVPTVSNGALYVPAGKLVLADSSDSSTEAEYSGITLYVPNAASGTELFNSRRKAANLFKVPGVDTLKVTAKENNVYVYSADGVSFIGIKMNDTTASIPMDGTKTLSVTTLPAVALPKDVVIKWEADKDTVKLTPSADTLSCAVQSVGYTAQNINGGNNVVVTATAVNKDGTAYIPPTTSDKLLATSNVTLTGESVPVLTTTVTDLDGKTTTVTADTVIKMTQSTYNTVDFAADKAGISEAALAFHTGNDKVAQTGTYTKWNGTAGKYNVYANGAVGSKVGVFANGVKVFQIEIVDRPFKCDTTLDLDGVKGKALTVGQKYSFKITPADGTKIDTFTFLTANDSAVASWGFVKNADGTVTATIKALKATDKIGVYAKINGVTYKVFAAAVK